MQSHLGSVLLCLASTTWLGPKFFRTFMRLMVEVYNLCRVSKTDISACSQSRAAYTLIWLINLKMDLNLYSCYFLWPCWVPNISVLTLAYRCLEEEGVKSVEDDAEFQAYAASCLYLYFSLYDTVTVIHLWCHFIYETWSWYTYIASTWFCFKTGCHTLPFDPSPRTREGKLLQFQPSCWLCVRQRHTQHELMNKPSISLD
jgi:hypothetical protein